MIDIIFLENSTEKKINRGTQGKMYSSTSLVRAL